jgi:hypothetical protein
MDVPPALRLSFRSGHLCELPDSSTEEDGARI